MSNLCACATHFGVFSSFPLDEPQRKRHQRTFQEPHADSVRQADTVNKRDI
jgi:hypothetical protein